MRILLTGARAPAALHLARLLHQGGMAVIVADCIRFPLTRGASYVERTLRHPAPTTDPCGFREWISRTIAAELIDLVIPSCEEVLHLAHAMGSLGLEERLVAPPFERLRQMHNKHSFVREMAAMGFEVPATEMIETPAQLAALGDAASRLVLKPVWSRFASRVLIRPTARDLRDITPTAADPWIAQEALEGQEICLYAVGTAGKLGAWRAYHPRIRVGQGAGIHFTPVADSSIEPFLEAFFARTSWTGQVSFDAFLTPERGLVPIECNPRATSGVHFFTHGWEFCRALQGNKVAHHPGEALQMTGAMLMFGLPAALRRGESPAWIHAWRAGRDAMAYSSRGARPLMKGACFVELAVHAARDRKGLLAGTTIGIEWDDNGAPASSSMSAPTETISDS